MKKQMSEAFITSMFLAMSGGLQDAYTYFTRGEVFSNAQTGNIVLMSEQFRRGEWLSGIRYLLPVIAFGLGVYCAEQIRGKYKKSKKLHWRQGILLGEIMILIVVGFLPVRWNLVATILVSFSCAMQVQTFRKVNGFAYASTMCIGNLRSGTEALAVYRREHNSKQLKRALHYFGIILLFAIGSGIGGGLSMLFGLKAIWASVLLLIVSFFLMIPREKGREKSLVG